MKNRPSNPAKPNKTTPNVTIMEVANHTNVSYSTVSRVINNDPHVSPETRDRVLASIRELGYTVNRQAQSLARGRSHIVGVLVPDLGTGYIGEIIRGIDAELDIADYDIMLYTTHRQEAKEAGIVATLSQGIAEGVLIILPRNPAAYLDGLEAKGTPYVLIDHQGINDKGPAVGATNWQGAYNATEHLIQLGHSRIGFIAGTMDLGAARDRLDGFRSALMAHHIPYDEQMLYYGDFRQPDGYVGGNQLLDLPEPPTAIFASNDVMAMGVMDAVRNRGLRIPDDVSVVGFDDIPQAAMLRPALTTVRQPLEMMGRVATQMLLNLLNGSIKDPKRIELPTQLILRDSCCSLQSS